MGNRRPSSTALASGLAPPGLRVEAHNPDPPLHLCSVPPPARALRALPPPLAPGSEHSLDLVALPCVPSPPPCTPHPPHEG